MIKVTHIPPDGENKAAEIIKSALLQYASDYFEVKVYGDGVDKSPTLKLTPKVGGDIHE